MYRMLTACVIGGGGSFELVIGGGDSFELVIGGGSFELVVGGGGSFELHLQCMLVQVLFLACFPYIYIYSITNPVKPWYSEHAHHWDPAVCCPVWRCI